MQTIKDLRLAITAGLHLEGPVAERVLTLTQAVFLRSVADKKLSQPNNSSVRELLEYPMLVTGEIGFGKTWLAHQIVALDGKRKLQDLDSTGSFNRDGKWQIDAKSVRTAEVYSGWGIGIREQIYPRVKTIVVPVPSYGFWKSIMNAKLMDGKAKNLSVNVMARVADLASYSESMYVDLVIGKLKLFGRDLRKDQVLIIVLADGSNVDTDKLKGWYA